MRLLTVGENEAGQRLDKLLGKPQIPEELWEEDVQKLLQNPAKLKNYPFEMTEEILKKYLNK